MRVPLPICDFLRERWIIKGEHRLSHDARAGDVDDVTDVWRCNPAVRLGAGCHRVGIGIEDFDERSHDSAMGRRCAHIKLPVGNRAEEPTCPITMYNLSAGGRLHRNRHAADAAFVIVYGCVLDAR